MKIYLDIGHGGGDSGVVANGYVEKDLNLRFRGSSNQRLIDVPASLESGTVVLWKDWQEERKR